MRLTVRSHAFMIPHIKVNCRSFINHIGRSFSVRKMPLHFSIEDTLLITELYALEQKSPKLVKSHPYPAPGEPNTLVCSWKLNEFKYYDIPSPFPTLARGLFSMKVSSENERGAKYRIVVRGYDKFFNIGEVPWTTVRHFQPFSFRQRITSGSGRLWRRTPRRHTRSLSSQMAALSSSPRSRQRKSS